MLDDIVSNHRLQARAVIGLYPANSVGDDDIELSASEHGNGEIAIVHTLRQQSKKPAGQPNFALADFVAPKDSAVTDYLGAFAVNAGFGLEEMVEKFEADHDDYHAIMAKALADRLAEALAERMHVRIRREYWGYTSDEGLDNNALISEKYQGIRPAPGYPACPDHTEKPMLWNLLDVEKNIGVRLTESFAMVPTAAVCGWYFSHPESRYFGVGKINRDQVRDYAKRKGMDTKETERWLGPNLGYDTDR
jgi:5-methyltetrahydrofolate--homocysteine methyltransferase